jgi:hypothetical protein
MTESENRRYLWRAGLAVAVVGAVSIGAIGIAAAAGDEAAPAAAAAAQPAPAPEEDDDHWGGPWRGGPWHGGAWGGGFGGDVSGILGADVDGILHGEVVLSKEGGGTQTVLVQRGAVTEVSATGVTVRSSDGFTTAYAVNGDTKVRADKDEIASVAKDEEVLVVAPKSGDRTTATLLVDLTDVGWK